MNRLNRRRSTPSSRDRITKDWILSEQDWNAIKHLIPPIKSGGRPAKYERRRLVEAILYKLRQGIPWTKLPDEVPPRQILYSYFMRWSKGGTLESILKE